MKFFVVFCLLLVSVYGQNTEPKPSSSGSPSSLFDSINKGLTDLKNTIQTTLNKHNRTNTILQHSTYSHDDSDPLFEGSHGHYYIEDMEKDRPFMRCSTPTDGDNIWKYSIPYLNESLGMLNFQDFKGKPLLLVNVATFCESTIEYPLYNELKDKYGDDLVVVGFPCNQFENQEPTGNPTEIFNAIKYVRPGNGFVPKFPLTQRIHVNGETQHPIFSFLKRCCPSTRSRFSVNEHKLLYKPKNSRDIRWNFEKFLIDPETGYPIKRYDQKYLPDRIVDDVEKVMQRLKRKQQPTTLELKPSSAEEVANAAAGEQARNAAAADVASKTEENKPTINVDVPQELPKPST